MRILLVNYEYPPLGGGAASATLHMARQWVSQGHEVCVLTSAFENLPRRETQDGVLIKRVRAVRKRASGSTPLEMATFVLGGLVRMPLLLRRWQPDVACLMFAVPCGPMGLITKVTSRLPYVVSLRGMDVPGFAAPDVVPYHRWIGPIVRLVLRHADGIVAISTGLKALAEPLVPGASIQVIPNGIDRTAFYPAAEPLPPSPLRLLFVGRLAKQKAVSVLLEAVTLLHRSGLDLHLTIVGDGPERLALEHVVAKEGLQTIVEFAGWQGRPQIPGFYRGAHIFVLPSYVESLGQVILEAMASGLPVVTTHTSNMANLIQHGKNGLLVPAGNSRALADAIERIARDEELRQRMSNESEKESQKHSWEAVAAQYIELFGAVLSRRVAVKG